MASYKTAFGSYLKAEDLQGKAVRITLERVSLEDIKGNDGKMERKLVAHFAGKDKGLVLNRTNADSLAAIFVDDDYDNWSGLIVLYPDMTTFGGKRVPCIRIRENAVAAAAAPPPPSAPVADNTPVTDDDIPF